MHSTDPRHPLPTAPWRAVGLLLLLALCQPAMAGCPRIVSQSPYITKTLAWLGLDGCIVGASRYDSLEVTETGGVMDPDAAAIHALHPDLVLLSDWASPEQRRALADLPALTLGGFKRMAEIEQNLRLIGQAAGLTDYEARAAAFARDWREKAQAVGGDGRGALLLSACSGAPYSFGRDSWLYELFSASGFHLVETSDALRFVGEGQEFADLSALIAHFQPELLFLFQPHTSEQCSAVPPRAGLRIIPLNGEHFLHPAPVLLKGLEELRLAMGQRP